MEREREREREEDLLAVGEFVAHARANTLSWVLRFCCPPLTFNPFIPYRAPKCRQKQSDQQPEAITGVQRWGYSWTHKVSSHANSLGSMRLTFDPL